MTFVLRSLLAGACAVAALPAMPPGFGTMPPFHLHFHQPGHWFGNPFGAVRCRTDQTFHFYYVTPSTHVGPFAAGPIHRGSVGHAETSDLVNWERRAAVIKPVGENCQIDGGSVIERSSDRALVLYFGQSCNGTSVLRRPTEIWRAVSTDCEKWTVDEEPLMTFNAGRHLTLPSVVYVPHVERFVMTLVGEYEEVVASPEIGLDGFESLPRFFQSVDGIAWTEGARFDAPNDIRFVPFASNFMMPLGDIWILMGTKMTQGGRPVPWFMPGKFGGTGAAFTFEASGSGGPLFWDWAARPFPAWGHPDYNHVMMSIMSQSDHTPSWDMLYQPLSLPLTIAPRAANSDPPEFLQSDWIKAVKDLIRTSSAVRSAWSPDINTLHKISPSRVSTNGTYSFEAKIVTAAPLSLELRAYHNPTRDDQASYADVFYEINLSALPDGGVSATHRWAKWTTTLPDAFAVSGGEPATRTHDLHIILDRNVVEVRLDGCLTRYHYWSNNKTNPDRFTLRTSSEIALSEGWTFDAVRAASLPKGPPVTPTSGPESGAGPRLVGSAALIWALLLSS